MAWLTPKTDWRRTDVFLPLRDYMRIRGNILHLAGEAAALYAPFALAPMTPAADDVLPFLDFFENPDRNTDRLMDSTFRPENAPRARNYIANGRVWDAADLNRMESAHLALHTAFAAQKNARPVLAFTLGGDLFVPSL